MTWSKPSKTAYVTTSVLQDLSDQSAPDDVYASSAPTNVGFDKLIRGNKRKGFLSSAAYRNANHLFDSCHSDDRLAASHSSKRVQKLPNEIERPLQSFLNGLQNLLGSQLIGFYLYGSIALDAYVHGESDIDFLCVTDGDLQEVDMWLIEKLFFDQMAIYPILAKLEGNFLAAHRLPLHNRCECAQCFEGAYLVKSPRDWNAITLLLLRNHGIPLLGPATTEIIPEVSASELANNMIGNLLYFEINREHYFNRGLHDQVFAVLTLCRILYTMRTGEVVSKQAAAESVLSQLPALGKVIIKRALRVWEKRPDTVRMAKTGTDLAPKDKLLEFVSIVKKLAVD
ncbi:DUF4111 domain-containing protein [Brevibacillus halotolerans]|uniref:aminoglycoside adenylyltransferase domain-containing protein n=1 Tax=Brevibacillus laterosporus TaxID=1465 RepID=UPI00215B8A14|nr:aminoglycoside adenylyltransferase domain-containing protein [Brevibacillus laterosporus]MCR8994310.1 DUF4111 domain-containing protein [Brevibacillus laterosporus]WPS88768.1 DUF4111 domain-containing protein [Brevibacillus halotolerans]